MGLTSKPGKLNFEAMGTIRVIRFLFRRRASCGPRGLAVISLIIFISCYRYSAPREQEIFCGQEVIVGVRLSVGQNNIRLIGSKGLVVITDGLRRQITPDQVVILDRKAGEIAVKVCADRGDSGAPMLWRLTNDTVTFISNGLIDVGGRRYRGKVRAFFIAETGMVVVNRVKIEEYLYGVVPAEIGPIEDETFEAVKAQAVAARSFTLSRLKRRGELGYDLYDSYMRDQEYRGADGEVALGRKAVDDTRGQVLVYHDEIAEALYHGNCGGVTADGAEPYLQAVYDTPGNSPKAMPFCALGKNFSWEHTVSRDSVENVLMRQKRLKTRLRVRNFKIEKDRLAKRVKMVRFLTDRREIAVSGSDLRFALGLKSTFFQMKLVANRFVFNGKGWGHGVGLCQDGALVMARKGYSCRRILTHYYPALRIKKIY